MSESSITNGAGIEVQVNTDILINKAQDAMGKIRTMKTKLDLFSQTVSRSGNYWRGEAGEQYRKSYEKNQKEAEQIMKRLAELPEILLQIAGVYADAENEAKQSSQPLPDTVIE